MTIKQKQKKTIQGTNLESLKRNKRETSGGGECIKLSGLVMHMIISCKRYPTSYRTVFNPNRLCVAIADVVVVVVVVVFFVIVVNLLSMNPQQTYFMTFPIANTCHQRCRSCQSFDLIKIVHIQGLVIRTLGAKVVILGFGFYCFKPSKEVRKTGPKQTRKGEKPKNASDETYLAMF